MVSEIAFVVSVGKGSTVDKAINLVKSINMCMPKSEIFSFVVNEELPDIYLYKIKILEEYSKVLYGDIPLPEYKFTSKHQALIQAGKESRSTFLACLDADMLVLNPITLPPYYQMYVVPVDIGNTSWGRESSRSKWEELYKSVGSDMPEEKIRSLIGNYPMFPFYNGGFVITSDHNFGHRWLETTKMVFSKMPDLEEYKIYRNQSKRRRLFTKIPYAHWTEQVALTLLASKYKTKVLDYDYDYPLNTRWSCPSDTKIVHYHDSRNLSKIKSKIYIKNIQIDNKLLTYPRIFGYQFLRGLKVRLGKF